MLLSSSILLSQRLAHISLALPFFFSLVYFFHLTLSCLDIGPTAFIINQREEYIFTAYRTIIPQHKSDKTKPIITLFSFGPTVGYVTLLHFKVQVFNYDSV